MTSLALLSIGVHGSCGPLPRMATRSTKADRDRILFPAAGFTLGDAVDYYRTVAPLILPHLRRRPLSFKRYPGPVDGPSYWEKDAPSFTPEWVRTVAVPRRSGESEIRYIVAGNARTLAWIAGVGGIELHPFLHRTSDIERPTHVVFDLDPGDGATIFDCARVAFILRDALQKLDLDSLVKVSGSRGLQLYVALNTAATHAMTVAFARGMAETLARKHRDSIVSRMDKSLRRGKVFIDWSQNAGYKTTVAVYSLRSRSERPLVSMPVSWKELERATASQETRKLQFEPAAAIARLERKGDLFAPLLRLKQNLPLAIVEAFRDRPTRKAAPADRPPLLRGKTLPKARSQGGRRLFVLPATAKGSELWLDIGGRFRRWILRSDREGGARLIAVPTAGSWPVPGEYYAGKVPENEKARVSIADIGSYEIVGGSFEGRRVDVFFSGKRLAGPWRFEKNSPDPKRRSWSLAPSS